MRSTWNEGRFGSPFFAERTSGVRMSGGTRRFLGQTAQEWYGRALGALQKWELLRARTDRVANKTERENIYAWLGSRANPADPFYAQASVDEDVRINVAEEGVGAYNKADRQGRVKRLEDFNKEFETRVSNAERTFGILPPSQVVERIIPGAPSAGPNLTVPILVGAGAVVAALLLF